MYTNEMFFYFPQLTITSQHQRHHRFCLRLLLKHPDNHALCVLCGHNAMVSGSFKHALGNKHTCSACFRELSTKWFENTPVSVFFSCLGLLIVILLLWQHSLIWHVFSELQPHYNAKKVFTFRDWFLNEVSQKKLRIPTMTKNKLALFFHYFS